MNFTSAKRVFWQVLGCICVGLGTIGIFVPLLPTTVFMLVAAFAFARSSPKLHNWLITHKVFGPLITDWQSHGAISTKAKFTSVVSMSIIIGVSAFFHIPNWLLITQILVLSCVAIFLLSRPKPPKARL